MRIPFEPEDRQPPGAKDAPAHPDATVAYIPKSTLIEAFMNGSWIRGIEVLVIVALGAGVGFAQDGPRDESKSNKMVLVELYTSQRCDMCPTAEL